MDHEGGTGRYLHFHFLSSLGIGEAGPAKDTTAFGLSFFFLFFSMSCICTIRGRHRPAPAEKLERSRCGLSPLALHMHRGVVLV